METERKETPHRTNRKFTAQEDAVLKKLVHEMGENCWPDLASKMKGRNARQCHDRWFNYLSPKINNSPWTPEEDDRLINLCYTLNGKWVKIAKRFKGRTDTQIKNRWNTLKKMYPLPGITKKPEDGQIAFENISFPKIKTSTEKTDDDQKIRNMTGNVFEQLASIFTEADNPPVDNTFDFLN